MAPKGGEGSDYQLVTPMMRLYLPRVEVRLKGITALWVCRKKGHLHTIPCNEQDWDKELAYNRHFTQWTYNKSYIIQSTHIVRLRTKPNEKKITQLLDPRSSQLGSTTDQHETIHRKGQDLHRAPPWAWLRHLHGIIGTYKLVLEVSVSHGDSAISHPRDQDYLSL